MDSTEINPEVVEPRKSELTVPSMSYDLALLWMYLQLKIFSCL